MKSNQCTVGYSAQLTLVRLQPSVPEDTELVNYRKPGFFSKFAELNQVMWNTNKGLTDSHPYDSRPQVRIYSAHRQDRPLFGGIILF